MEEKRLIEIERICFDFNGEQLAVETSDYGFNLFIEIVKALRVEKNLNISHMERNEDLEGVVNNMGKLIKELKASRDFNGYDLIDKSMKHSDQLYNQLTECREKVLVLNQHIIDLEDKLRSERKKFE